MKLADYVKKRGMQTMLANSIAVAPVLVHQWAKGKRAVPPHRCKAIEAATEGKVKRHELRPDIFDPPDYDSQAA